MLSVNYIKSLYIFSSKNLHFTYFYASGTLLILFAIANFFHSMIIHTFHFNRVYIVCTPFTFCIPDFSSFAFNFDSDDIFLSFLASYSRQTYYDYLCMCVCSVHLPTDAKQFICYNLQFVHKTTTNLQLRMNEKKMVEFARHGLAVAKKV